MRMLSKLILTAKQVNLGCLGLIVAVASSMPTVAEQQVIRASPKYCKPGLHRQPNGPYAVMLFCDDALGSNIGVIRIHLGAPTADAWSLHDRFWQDGTWGGDVTAFAWDSERDLLLVSTEAIYGTGAVYRIQLKTRQYSTLFPPGKGKQWCDTEITSIDRKRRTLTIKIGDCNLSTTRTVAVGY